MSANKGQFVDPLEIMNKFIERPASEENYPYSEYWQKRLAALCEDHARVIQMLLMYADPFEMFDDDRASFEELHRKHRPENYTIEEEGEEVDNADEQAES